MVTGQVDVIHHPLFDASRRHTPLEVLPYKAHAEMDTVLEYG